MVFLCSPQTHEIIVIGPYLSYRMQRLIGNLLLCTALLFVVALNTSFVDMRNDKITFTAFFGKDALVRDKKYFCPAKGDSISVNVCRFYISKVELLAEHDWVMGTYDYKLIDVFDTASASFNVPYYSHMDIESIRFYLGIDSTTNMAGVGEGDLDPTKGMYWAWQSGFINMKLEGNSSLCVKTKNEFQYHLGGYAAPNNALKIVKLDLSQDIGDLNIKVDVEQFFSRIDIGHISHIMSPSVKAVELSSHAARMFSIIE